MAVMLTTALEVMAVDYKPIPPYSKNASGPFYVEDGPVSFARHHTTKPLT